MLGAHRPYTERTSSRKPTLLTDRACVQLEGWVIVMSTKKIKPGTPAPASGQYRPVGGGSEVTAVKGKPLPPTSQAGQAWKLVDKTKHKPKPK